MEIVEVQYLMRKVISLGFQLMESIKTLQQILTMEYSLMQLTIFYPKIISKMKNLRKF